MRQIIHQYIASVTYSIHLSLTSIRPSPVSTEHSEVITKSRGTSEMFDFLLSYSPINFDSMILLSQNFPIMELFLIIFIGLLIIFIINSIIYVIGLINKKLSLKINNFINFYINIVEKEIMGLSMLMRIGICLFLFFASYNYSIAFTEITPIIFYISLYFLGILFLTVLLIPFYLLFSYGAYFIAYVKGGSLKKSILFEFLADSLNLLSFFLRINIQFIRIALILFMFILYDEQYYSMVYPWYNTSNLNSNLNNFSDYLYYYTSMILIIILRGLYELAHFWVIFFMQSTVFALIITMLIQFLYTMYLVKNLIIFFNKFRK